MVRPRIQLHRRTLAAEFASLPDCRRARRPDGRGGGPAGPRARRRPADGAGRGARSPRHRADRRARGQAPAPAEPSTSRASTSGPSSAWPSSAGPSSSRASSAGPSTAGLSTASPSPSSRLSSGVPAAALQSWLASPEHLLVASRRGHRGRRSARLPRGRCRDLGRPSPGRRLLLVLYGRSPPEGVLGHLPLTTAAQKKAQKVFSAAEKTQRMAAPPRRHSRRLDRVVTRPSIHREKSVYAFALFLSAVNVSFKTFKIYRIL